MKYLIKQVITNADGTTVETEPQEIVEGEGYIEYDSETATLTLGKNGDPSKVTIDNDSMDIVTNGEIVATFGAEGSTFYAEDGEAALGYSQDPMNKQYYMTLDSEKLRLLSDNEARIQSQVYDPEVSHIYSSASLTTELDGSYPILTLSTIFANNADPEGFSCPSVRRISFERDGIIVSSEDGDGIDKSVNLTMATGTFKWQNITIVCTRWGKFCMINMSGQPTTTLAAWSEFAANFTGLQVWIQKNALPAMHFQQWYQSYSSMIKCTISVEGNVSFMNNVEVPTWGDTACAFIYPIA